jgi:hypothetical protein
MYSDLRTNPDRVQTPREVVHANAARDCARLAEDTLAHAHRHVSEKTPFKFTPAQDRLFTMKSGKRVAKLDDAEIAANRNGGSTDPRVGAAIRFAAELVRRRGKVSGEAIEAVRAAGYGDAAILEIVGHVALNTFTNYVNEAFATEVDFPAAAVRQAA